jgi:hypothetical protein
MTPDPRHNPNLDQSRLVMLLTVRAMGVVAMLAGLGLWLGGWVHGGEAAGPLVFVAGAALSFLVPVFLARRWRTPR